MPRNACDKKTHPTCSCVRWLGTCCRGKRIPHIPERPFAAHTGSSSGSSGARTCPQSIGSQRCKTCIGYPGVRVGIACKILDQKTLKRERDYYHH
ncbi:hypothetical protein NPIL_534981 [Nephila pilipes]|uniref:Uncharacterized protein n=1 Tax=Nephila pilipes TaxID=299642 RepID=A0A8X6TBU3_NEPPI|nr:hypothetical protein NPIL_534981 [Nephila pilipes]